MSDQLDLIKVYENTDYIFEAFGKKICINIAQPNKDLTELLQKLNAQNWIFITAYNPMSKVVSDDENEKSQLALINDLETLKLKYFFGEGKSKDGQWPPEKSLFVLDIDNYDTEVLMNKYRQKAIVAGQIDQLPILLYI